MSEKDHDAHPRSSFVQLPAPAEAVVTRDERGKGSVDESSDKHTDNSDPELRTIARHLRKKRKLEDLYREWKRDRLLRPLRTVLSWIRSLAFGLRLWRAKSAPADNPSPEISRIDHKVLIAVAPGVRRELAQRLASGVAAPAALYQVFIHFFGEPISAADQMRFATFAAPLARKIALQSADKESLVVDDITVATVQEVYNWLDVFDPMAARILDVYYFAGASIRETARAFKLEPCVILRELRYVKSWAGLTLQE